MKNHLACYEQDTLKLHIDEAVHVITLYYECIPYAWLREVTEIFTDIVEYAGIHDYDSERRAHIDCRFPGRPSARVLGVLHFLSKEVPNTDIGYPLLARVVETFECIVTAECLIAD